MAFFPESPWTFEDEEADTLPYNPLQIEIEIDGVFETLTSIDAEVTLTDAEVLARIPVLPW